MLEILNLSYWTEIEMGLYLRPKPNTNSYGSLASGLSWPSAVRDRSGLNFSGSG